MKSIEVRRELVARDVGDEEPHPAANVVADGLRHDEAARLPHRADGNPAATMKVGREHDALKSPDLVAPERAGPAAAFPRGDLVDRALHVHEPERLLDRFELDRNIAICKQRDGHAVWIWN